MLQRGVLLRTRQLDSNGTRGPSGPDGPVGGWNRDRSVPTPVVDPSGLRWCHRHSYSDEKSQTGTDLDEPTYHHRLLLLFSGDSGRSSRWDPVRFRSENELDVNGRERKPRGTEKNRVHPERTKSLGLEQDGGSGYHGGVGCR